MSLHINYNSCLNRTKEYGKKYVDFFVFHAALSKRQLLADQYSFNHRLSNISHDSYYNDQMEMIDREDRNCRMYDC